jgi:hypothetical protein
VQEVTGQDGKVDDHGKAVRHKVSLGESVALAQHIMQSSGEDAYDHAVKKFMQTSDIDVRSWLTCSPAS